MEWDLEALEGRGWAQLVEGLPGIPSPSPLKPVLVHVGHLSAWEVVMRVRIVTSFLAIWRVKDQPKLQETLKKNKTKQIKLGQ